MKNAIKEITFPDGITRKVVELTFEVVNEGWNDYNLSDGTKFRMRNTVQKVFRVLDPDGKPAFTPEGDPFIIVRSNNQISSSE